MISRILFLIIAAGLFCASCSMVMNAEDHSREAKQFASLKQYDKALYHFNAAITMSGKSGNTGALYLERGMVHYKQSRYDLATNDFNSAISYDPKLAKAYYYRGLVYHIQNNYTLALESYNAAVPLDITNHVLYYSRAVVYYKLNQYDNAINDYDKAIMLKPNFAQAYSARGLVYTRLNQPDKAVTSLQKAISLAPDDIWTTHCMASYYAIINDMENACVWFKRSVETGFADWEHIKKDADLDNLRNTRCYKEIMDGK